MDKIENTTMNISPPNEGLKALKKHYAHCFDSNGFFDFEKFKTELQKKETTFKTEDYSFNWLGKSYARLLATEPATTLLKEDREWNTIPDNKNSDNILIKGDNLEVLKHLSNAYFEKIKLIYLDPPYNTGNDGFVYKDNKKYNENDLAQLIGADLAEAKKILTYIDGESNTHSAWLNFMYPRLYIAKKLLKEDGTIFISIDDNEICQLKLLMDEIFGENNFISQLTVIMNLKGNNDQFGFAGTHEYILVYAKNYEKTTLNEFPLNDEELDKWDEDELGPFKQGATLKASGNNAPRKKRENLYYPIYIDDENNIYVTKDDSPPSKYIGKIKTIYPLSEGQELSWRWSKDTVSKNKHEIIVKRSNEITLYKKQRPSLSDIITKKPKSIFYKPKYSSGNGTLRIKQLFGEKLFTNPKPTELLKDILLIATNQNDYVLDLFAGSGTTGEAVVELNAQDGGKRKYILVQIPEKIDQVKNTVEYNYIYNKLKTKTPTVFEITKERLTKVNEETKKNIESSDNIFVSGSKIDTGFRIFQTQPIWGNYNFEAKSFDNQLLFDSNLLNEEDISSLLLTWKTFDNIPLTEDLEQINFNGYVGHYANHEGRGKLYLVNKDFKTDHLLAILEKLELEKSFNPTVIVAFGYNFDSKALREISEGIATFTNKKQLDIDFITRY